MTEQAPRPVIVDTPYLDRARLAATLRELQAQAADRLTADWFRAQPADATRFGETGRARTREDFGYHIAFLASAIEFGSPAAFEEYILWTTGVLDARGIGPGIVRKSIDQVALVLEPQLDANARQVVDAFIGAARCAIAGYLVPSAEPAGGDPAHGVFLHAILSGERRAAVSVVREWLASGRTIEDVYVNLVQEALARIGRLWEANRISVADEHLATAIVQYVLAQLYEQLPSCPVRRGNMVVTGVEGEFHQVGAHIVADLLEADGWNVHFLGANVPAAGILHQVKAHEARVVGISATMLVSLPAVRRLIADLTRVIVPAPYVIVGGAAFRSADTAWRDVGADAFAPGPIAARAILRHRAAGDRV
jgi:methanogenic corrinoid protein MtbC1